MNNPDRSIFINHLTKVENHDHIDWLDDLMEAEQASVTHTEYDEDLAKRVQNLPPELYNLIYKATFSFSPVQRCIYHKRDGQYEPPAILQVDRASRNLAAQSYYKNTTFCFAVKAKDGEDFVKVYDNPAQRWLLSLTQEHRSEMRKVRVACCGNTLAWVNIMYV